MEIEICKICGFDLLVDNDTIAVVKARGLKTLKKASEIRGDGKFSQLDVSEDADELRVHFKCRKKYNNINSLRAAAKRAGLVKTESQKQLLEVKAVKMEKGAKCFNYKDLCILCGEDASEEYIWMQIRKPMEERDKVWSVQSKNAQKKIMHSALSLGAEVRARTKDLDLIALNARYHQKCYKKFGCDTGHRNQSDRRKKKQQNHSSFTINEENLSNPKFNFKKLCVLCGNDASEKYRRSLAAEKNPVVNVMKQTTVDSFYQACFKYDDKWREMLRVFLKDKDLVTLRARYHDKCRMRLYYRPRGTRRGRPRKYPRAEDDVEELSFGLDDEPLCDFEDETYIYEEGNTETAQSSDVISPPTIQSTDVISPRTVQISVNAIGPPCHGCLSKNRKLFKLTDDYREIFDACLDVNDCNNENRPTLVCWECGAVLRKIKHFKTQVRMAQSMLDDFDQINETGLSNITVKVLENINLCGNENLELENKLVNSNCYGQEKYLLSAERDGNVYNVTTEIKVDNINSEDEYIDMDTNDNETDEIEDNHNQKTDSAIEQTERVTHNNENINSLTNDVRKERVVDNAIDGDTSVNELNLHIKANNTTKIKDRPQRYKILETYNFRDVVKRVKIIPKDVRKWMEREKKSEYYRNLKVKCELCVSRISPQDNLPNHMTNHHTMTPIRKHFCIICRQYLPKNKLNSHLSNHYFLFKCVKCGYVCCDQHHMRDHVRTHRSVECLDCGAVLACWKMYNEHYKKLHKQFFCAQCNKKFYSLRRLEIHAKREHTVHKCTICDITFSQHVYKRRHMESQHTVEKSEKNYCVTCDKLFPNRAKFKMHLYSAKIHVMERGKYKRPDRVKCLECPNTYFSQTAMRNHYLKEHKNEKRFYCNICDKNFLTKDKAEKHNLYVHQGVERPRNKICDICGRGFYLNTILENHMRTHTGEKPFQCPHCDASFAQKVAMRSHVKHIHKGLPRDKPKRPEYMENVLS